MNAVNRALVTWLPGPLLAVGMVSLAFMYNVGPGALVMVLVLSVCLLVGAPIVQLALVRTARFRGRHVAASVAVIGGLFTVVLVAALTGVFSFW